MKILIVFAMALGCALILYTQVNAQDEFDDFKTEFQNKERAAMGNDPIDTWDSLSLYASKKFVARSTSLAFNKSEVTVEAVLPDQAIGNLPTVNMTFPQIIKSCAPRCMSCCDCGLFKPGCCACHIARGACIIAEAPLIIACQAAKTVLDAAAGKHVGDITFDNARVQAAIDATPLNLNVADDFSAASLRSTTGGFRARAVVQGSVHVRLKTLAGVFLACWPSQDLTIPPTPIVVSTSDPIAIENTAEPVAVENGLELKLKMKKASAKVRYSFVSFIELIVNNPRFVITCPLPATLLIAAAVGDLIFDFDKSFDLPTPETPVQIGFITLKRPGSDQPLRLMPRISALSFGVVEAPIF
jgi:hypothetical protein